VLHLAGLVGYDPNLFIVRNSWGTTDWGDQGFGYASNAYASAAFTEAYGVNIA
jgi:C1A family cysteine protease